MHSTTTLKPGAIRVAAAISRETAGSASGARKATFALIVVLLVAWFASLELRGLFIPDEGRYAEIPREMLDTGDWVTPRLNGLKYFDKPPMQYWLTAASFAVLGEDEWTARLPSTLLGFLAVVMTAFTARQLWDARAALTAGVVLGSSWAYYLSGQYLTLDIMLSAFLSFALCAQAQTFTTLGNFTGFNGAYPFFGKIVQSTNGNYYGSTAYGGKNKNYGAIFQLTKAGTCIPPSNVLNL